MAMTSVENDMVTFQALQQTLTVLTKNGELKKVSAVDYWIKHLVEKCGRTEPFTMSVIDANFQEIDSFIVRPGEIR